jgi:hypothetical protein
MLEEISNGFQSLHLHTLTLSPTGVNGVKRWSKVETISFIRPMMCVLSIRDGMLRMERHRLGLVQWFLKVFDNGLGQIKDLL